VRSIATPTFEFHAVLKGRTDGLASDLVQRISPQQLGDLLEIERFVRQVFRGQHLILGVVDLGQTFLPQCCLSIRSTSRRQ
jgi:hypothetical protein